MGDKDKKHRQNISEPFLAKLLRWGVYCSALMPLIIFNDYLSPFHFGKVIVFRSFAEIMAVFYILLLVRYGQNYLPPRSKLFWGVTCFTLVFGLATLTSFDRFNSFWGTLERMGGWFSFIHFWIFFVIMTAVLRKKEHWLTLINVSIFTSLASVSYGFLQKTSWNWIIGSGSRQKIFGTIGNPALFAGYILMNAFLALIMFLRPDNKSNLRFWQLAIFLLNILGVFMTGVRGSVIGVVVGILVFFFLHAIDLKSRAVRQWAFILLIFVIISASALSLLKNTNFIKNNSYLSRYSDVSISSRTVQTRFWAWQAGFDGFNDSLRSIIAGYGPENFNIPFSKHFNPKFYEGPGSETLFDRAHNQFVEVLVTMGVAGLIAYLSIFIFAFQSLGKLSRIQDKEFKVYRSGIFASLIAYMIHNFFIFDTSANYLMFFLILGFLNFLVLPPEGLIRNELKLKRAVFSSLAAPILLTVAAFTIYSANIKLARANYITTRAIVASWAGQYDIAYDKFKEALSYDTFGKYEIRHRFIQYVLERLSGKKIDKNDAEKLLLAIEYVKKNADEHEYDYLPYLYTARSYILLGKDDLGSSYNDLAINNIKKIP